MDLPGMTPLQAVVVSTLFEGELSSRRIHDELDFHGISMKMPLVYRLLGRMEQAQYLCGRYRQWQTTDGRTVRERFYRVSQPGFDAWQQTVAFFAALDGPSDTFRPTSLGDCHGYDEG